MAGESDGGDTVFAEQRPETGRQRGSDRAVGSRHRDEQRAPEGRHDPRLPPDVLPSRAARIPSRHARAREPGYRDGTGVTCHAKCREFSRRGAGHRVTRVIRAWARAASLPRGIGAWARGASPRRGTGVSAALVSPGVEAWSTAPSRGAGSAEVRERGVAAGPDGPADRPERRPPLAVCVLAVRARRRRAAPRGLQARLRGGGTPRRVRSEARRAGWAVGGCGELQSERRRKSARGQSVTRRRGCGAGATGVRLRGLEVTMSLFRQPTLPRECPQGPVCHEICLPLRLAPFGVVRQPEEPRGPRKGPCARRDRALCGRSRRRVPRMRAPSRIVRGCDGP